MDFNILIKSQNSRYGKTFSDHLVKLLFSSEKTET